MTIGIFGYGTMGKAIYSLLKKENPNQRIIIHTRTKNTDISQADILFVCIKPQDFYHLKATRKLQNKIVISIMASVQIKQLQSIFVNARIIRTMPNLPSQIQQGVIGWYTDTTRFSENELKKIKNIFSYFGYEFIVSQEDQLNAVTAISGNGPAYVFLFIHMLLENAQKLGFNVKTSEAIVLNTVKGSIRYLENQNVKNIFSLIERISSKGGTTEAALKQLHITSYLDNWKKAIEAAYQKSTSLSK